MDNKLKNFIANMGMLCETWTVVYNSFISQGMAAKDALTHTQAFMSAFMASVPQNGGKE